MNIIQAAKELQITRAAVYMAITNNRLNAKKDSCGWTITLDDVIKYKNSRYKKECPIIDGKPLFDRSRGEVSIKEASILLKCQVQKLYHACRYKHMKSEKRKCHWIITLYDIIEYRNKLNDARLEKRKKQREKNVLGNKCYRERLRKKTDKKVSFLRRIQSK